MCSGRRIQRWAGDSVSLDEVGMETGAAAADEAQVALLQEMGFSVDQCREALRLSSNQVRAPPSSMSSPLLSARALCGRCH